MSDLVASLRAQRKNPIVLKAKLIGIRSSRPDTLVFVFEGADDVGVYDAWIRRISETISYEPLPGCGKEQVLGFRRLLDADNHLRRRLYFFVDMDYDVPEKRDCRTFEPEAYSTENLIATVEVLDSVLADEFRCAADPTTREQIVDLFRKLNKEFAAVAYEYHLRMFTARRLGIPVQDRPEHVADFANVELQTISSKGQDPLLLVALEREPTGDQRESFLIEFDALPMSRAVRGKYAIQMFRRWVTLLAIDRKSAYPSLFSKSGIVVGEPHSLPLRRFASSSRIPAGLPEFVLNAMQEG